MADAYWPVNYTFFWPDRYWPTNILTTSTVVAVTNYRAYMKIVGASNGSNRG
jgi:hypothetical protein